MDSASGLGLPSAGPLPWWRVLAGALFHREGTLVVSWATYHSLQQVKSRCAVCTVVVWGPEAQDRPMSLWGTALSLPAAFPPTPALCPPVPSSSCRHTSCQRCVSLPLSLSSARALGSVERAWGPKSWVGKPPQTCQGCCMGFSLSLC